VRDFNVEDFLISSDNKLAYLLTSDKKIKEFLLMTVSNAFFFLGNEDENVEEYS
jgi:hypothetical protein